MNLSAQDSELKRLMLILNHSFDLCGSKTDRITVEKLAQTIFQVMSARYRIFHTMDHIFSVSTQLSGTPAIAALMHDLVYFQVDKRIHPFIQKYLSEFTINEQSLECILPDLNSERWVSICARIFGVEKGRILTPFNGLNEFLSAVTSARMFSPYLKEWDILEIITAIEATIPFRSQLDPIHDPFLILEDRLKEIRNDLSLEVSDYQVKKTIQKALLLANEDISSFYSPNFGDFISGTWNLILENNPIFRNPLYTVRDYSKALLKVESFLSKLIADQVVHHFAGVPNPETFKLMISQTDQNLRQALLYLDLKLIEITVLVVLSEQSGGDAPYFLLIGRSDHNQNLIPIEQYFPEQKERVNQQINETVLEVLKKGRKSKQTFDFNHSPIAAYFYERMNAEEISNAIAKARDYHNGKIDASGYLKCFRMEILQPIIKGVSEVSWSRKLI